MHWRMEARRAQCSCAAAPQPPPHCPKTSSYFFISGAMFCLFKGYDDVSNCNRKAKGEICRNHFIGRSRFRRSALASDFPSAIRHQRNDAAAAVRALRQSSHSRSDIKNWRSHARPYRKRLEGEIFSALFPHQVGGTSHRCLPCAAQCPRSSPPCQITTGGFDTATANKNLKAKNLRPKDRPAHSLTAGDSNGRERRGAFVSPVNQQPIWGQVGSLYSDHEPAGIVAIWQNYLPVNGKHEGNTARGIRNFSRVKIHKHRDSAKGLV